MLTFGPMEACLQGSWKLLPIDFKAVLSGSSNAHEDCPLCVEESYIRYSRRFPPPVLITVIVGE